MDSALSLSGVRGFMGTAGERGGNNLNGFQDFRTENGPRHGRNLALTGVFVPSLLDSGSHIVSN